MQSRDGLLVAQQRGLDLVEISPNVAPPICKIIDFGKYKYEQQKKHHASKQKQKVIETKELKLRPTIADGDYNVKLNSIKKFIKNGDKVKISIVFRGREIVHNETGFALVERLMLDIAEFAKSDSQPKLEGKQIGFIISPLAK